MRTRSLAERRVLVVAGGGIAALGLATLLGWVCGWRLLTSFGADLIPMAPSTAVLFLLCGVAVCLRAWMPLGPLAYWISAALGGLVALVAALLFALACQGIQWPVEHLGLNITEVFGGSPQGHSSPITAFCFLLASLSFLASLSQSAIRPWRVVLALGSATTPLMVCLFLAVAYLFDAPLVHSGTFIPPAINTVFGFTLLGFALLIFAGWPVRLLDGSPGIGFKSAFTLTLVFLLLASGILAAGCVYFQHYEKARRAEAEYQLAAIAELKRAELVRWREERLIDAAIFRHSTKEYELMRRVLDAPQDTKAQIELCEQLTELQKQLPYDQIALLDAQGVQRFSIPPATPVAAVVARSAVEMLRSRRTAFQDFYRDEHDQRVRLAVLVPVFDQPSSDRVIGTVVLRIDPEKYLFPMIRHWPTPSPSAETLLVRREGADVVFLNELRFQQGTALTLRRSLTFGDLPAAKAVLGQEGIVEGVDYRGVSVLTNVGAIPRSPWFLIARIDMAELYAPMRTKLWEMVILTSALILCAGAVVSVVWRQQNIQFHRQKFELEKTLFETLSILRTAMNSSQMGIAIADAPDGKLRYVNDAGLLIRGGDRQSVINGIGIDRYVANWQLLNLHGEPLTRDEVPLTRAVLYGEYCSKEFIIRRDTGEDRIVTANASPIMDKQGNVVAGIVIFADITERKRAEETKSLLASIVECSCDAILSKTMDGIVLTWNAGAEELYGYRAEEIVGKSVSILASPDHSDELPQVLERIRRGERIDQYETVRMTKGGKLIPVSLTVSPITDARGRITGASTIARDITEQKRREEELRGKNAELEHFSYTVSHDLKSPLVTIKGFLGCLEQDIPGADAEEVKQDIEFIRRAADKMGRLLDELLRISRVGLVVNPPASVALQDLVQDALDAVAGSIRARAVEVKMHLGQQPILLYGDRTRLAEIWQNLLENAVKFMGDQPSPCVEIGIESHGQDTVFFVRDNGIGIDPRFQGKIFGIFERIDPEIEGTGVGLALIKRIVEIYHGTIWLESQGLGLGTCFRFTLPEAVRNQNQGELS
ncbi:MAG: PAS domain S-box protein [Planctomycetota bacterium]